MKCAVCDNQARPGMMTCSLSCRQSLVASKKKPPESFPKICDLCGKEYPSKSPRSKWCSTACQARNNWLTHREYYKDRDRLKVTKQRIGLDIRDEHLQTPSDDAKWLWDGEGKWSVKYWPDIRDCLECNTHVYRHRAFGVCERCYDKLRTVDEEHKKQLHRDWYKKQKAAGAKSSQVKAKEWVRRAKDREIPVTPKIENLLENYENLSNA